MEPLTEIRSRNQTRLSATVLGWIGFACACLLCTAYVSVATLDIPGALAIRTMPIPPNATVQWSARDRIRFQRLLKLETEEEYITSLSVASITEYYSRELGARGYKLRKQYTLTAQMSCYVFESPLPPPSRIRITELSTQVPGQFQTVVRVNTATWATPTDPCQ